MNLFVYSQTSVDKCEVNLNNFDISIVVDVDTDYSELQPYIDQDFDLIIGFGGGTAIDIAKYIACKSNATCIAIPTMLSTDVYSTNKCCVKFNGVKSTEQAVKPISFFNREILELSSKENLYGLIDVFSIFTALLDWKLADSFGIEPIDEIIYTRAEYLLEAAIHYSIIRSDWYRLYEIIQYAGEITNDYGCGRPESGSEHIFSKLLEERFYIPHAVGVAIGIVCRSNIVKLEPTDYYKYKKILSKMRKIGIFDTAKNLGVTYDSIESVLKDIQPRVDRFTILDIVKLDIEYIMKGVKNDIGW